LGQVRKDILNGWKEIGGYLGRDIRTVERWEKLRGLPVRRMPGAGRATVYALISDLDEWLEKTEPNGLQSAESSAEYASSGAVPAIHAVHQPALERQTGSVAVEDGNPPPPRPWQADRPVPAEDRVWLPPIQSGGRPSAETSRQRRIALVTLAVAAGLACVLAWPVIRSHAKPLVSGVTQSRLHSQEAALAPYRSRIPGVDDLYLRGVYSYEQRTPESLRRSLEDFSAASAKDPSYAPAYAGLANTYNLLREYSVMPDSEAYPKAKQAAEHAIALNPGMPDAHASLGFIDFFWSWNAAAAEHEFQTALALDPNSALAHHWYGSMLLHEGRFAEAIEQLEMAQRLEPNSAAILSTRALALGLDGHRSEAVEMLRDALNESPGASSPHAILATLSNVEPRDPALYLAEMRRSAELRHDPEAQRVFAEAASAYRSHDEDRMWAAILASEENFHPGTTHRTYLMAAAEAAMGKNDKALADLTQMAARHDPAVIGILIDPTFESLHSDRRFVQLAASIGLPATRN
jgi:tetratricopeptide (TPR) repeat protein